MQRGHNRQTVFTCHEDFAYYRQNIIECKETFGCKVYAYCLMTNHVHLIIDPGNTPEAISLMMKRISGRQARYLNTREKRSGSLWEGRFKSSIISDHDYLLACCRYIELNPLRAGMVEKPDEYKWSSYGCRGLGKADQLVDLDRYYLALGETNVERQNAYADYVTKTIPEKELDLIRSAIQRNQLTGNHRYSRQIEDEHGIRIVNRGQGRPRKTER
ncbi:putative transposase [Desulfopila aestuarii DSM 18488]|uniref:Putative transposase n=2 Tax=Desulfopila aestuarii TaxID=231440 RepID=A0A1M7Y542_9BACT|nr:putative transposase [Desulfopila aestuarii DSM 18488]